MNPEAPPTLQELAGQSLLRKETLLISVLEDLPRIFFPLLFKEASTSRQTNILRKMVAAWPFSCLPLGSLMKMPELETLKAVLHGIDDLLEVKVPPRRCKLQVLDLRDVNQNFWNGGSSVWSGPEDGLGSPQVTSQKQAMEDHPASGERQALIVLSEFCLQFFPYVEEHEDYLLQWARQRKCSLRLCCKTKHVESWPFNTFLKVLDVGKPCLVKNLQVWTQQKLDRSFSCYHARIRVFCSIYCANTCEPSYEAPALPFRSTLVDKLFSQACNFSSHQHLHLSGVHFRDRVEQMLEGLKTPLETLTINSCLLSQSDWNYLPLCPNVGQLKHLDLSGVSFSFCPLDSLHILLDRVTGTLETLDMYHCFMTDYHLSTLLPVLSRCSKVTRLNFYDNNISLPVLKDLLYHTASLRKLVLELYPAPLECYAHGHLDRERFDAICHQLMDTLRPVREPKVTSFASTECPRCEKRYFYKPLKSSLCGCWEE